MKWPSFRRQREPEKRALTYDDFPMELLSPATSAGIHVSPESAMRSPTVLAAARAIYETIGMLPIVVRSKNGDIWERDRNHPAAKVLSGFANGYTSCTDLRMQLQKDAVLHGVGYAQIIRIRGEVRELKRLPPRSVAVEYDDYGEPSYRVSLQRQSVVLPYSDVLHIATPGSAPDSPVRLIDLCRDSIALDILLTRHISKTFKGGSGGLPRMVLSPQGEPLKAGDAPTALKNALSFLKEQLDSESNDPILLPSNFAEAFKSFGLREMQFVDIRKLIFDDIAHALRVPVSVIGDLSRATYNNVENQSRSFLQYLLPWLEVWEGALTRALLKPEERDHVEFEFETRDLLRGDFAAQATAYRTATGGAWLTVNEVRELEGRPPHPDGDKLILQAGQADAGESGNQPSNDNKPPQAPEKPDDDDSDENA